MNDLGLSLPSTTAGELEGLRQGFATGVAIGQA
jgi:hypothetical protein